MAKTGIKTTFERFDIEKQIDLGTFEGLEEVGIELTTQAKSLQLPDQGRLRNSLMYKLSNGKNGGFNDKSGEKASGNEKLSGTPTGKSVVVGSNVDYAVYEEFGTSRRGAKPFLRPAVEIVLKGGNADKAMKKALNESVNKAKIKKRKREVL